MTINPTSLISSISHSALVDRPNDIGLNSLSSPDFHVTSAPTALEKTSVPSAQALSNATHALKDLKEISPAGGESLGIDPKEVEKLSSEFSTALADILTPNTLDRLDTMSGLKSAATESIGAIANSIPAPKAELKTGGGSLLDVRAGTIEKNPKAAADTNNEKKESHTKSQSSANAPKPHNPKIASGFGQGSVIHRLESQRQSMQDEIEELGEMASAGDQSAYFRLQNVNLKLQRLQKCIELIMQLYKSMVEHRNRILQIVAPK